VAMSSAILKLLKSNPKQEKITPRVKNKRSDGSPDLFEILVAIIAKKRTRVISNKFINSSSF
jgi:hypothetical protein